MTSLPPWQSRKPVFGVLRKQWHSLGRSLRCIWRFRCDPHSNHVCSLSGNPKLPTFRERSFSREGPTNRLARIWKGLTHWRRVFSVSKNEINFSGSTRWTKPLLIDAIASLLGRSCLTKLLEENDARRTRFRIPARSAPRWGVPRNTTAAIDLCKDAYSGLLYASMMACGQQALQ